MCYDLSMTIKMSGTNWFLILSGTNWFLIFTYFILLSSFMALILALKIEHVSVLLHSFLNF